MRSDLGPRIKNMFDDLPPDLDRLQTLRIWHAMWVQRIDNKIAAIRQRQAEEEHGRRHRPTPADWIVELGIGARRPPLQVHAGDCSMAGKRHRPVDRDEARRLLASGLRACAHCRPDVHLHIIDLSSRAGAAGDRAAGVVTSRQKPSEAVRTDRAALSPAARAPSMCPANAVAVSVDAQCSRPSSAGRW